MPMSWAGCGPAGFAIMAEGLTASKRGIVARASTSNSAAASIG